MPTFCLRLLATLLASFVLMEPAAASPLVWGYSSVKVHPSFTEQALAEPALEFPLHPVAATSLKEAASTKRWEGWRFRSRPTRSALLIFGLFMQGAANFLGAQTKSWETQLQNFLQEYKVDTNHVTIMTAPSSQEFRNGPDQAIIVKASQQQGDVQVILNPVLFTPTDRPTHASLTQEPEFIRFVFTHARHEISSFKDNQKQLRDIPIQMETELKNHGISLHTDGPPLADLIRQALLAQQELDADREAIPDHSINSAPVLLFTGPHFSKSLIRRQQALNAMSPDQRAVFEKLAPWKSPIIDLHPDPRIDIQPPQKNSEMPQASFHRAA